MSESTRLCTQILKSPKLPTVPAVAIRLLELAQDPDTPPRQIIDTLKSDPALAAKLLKAANSSFFSFRSEIKTLEQAVPLIGRTAVTSLALSFSLASEAAGDSQLAASYQHYWLQSLVQAAAGECWAKHMGAALSSELFMTGLLLDLGQLAMLKVLRTDYVSLIRAATEAQRPLHELEFERLGYSHVDVGQQLMRSWKLPTAMIKAVELHHCPVEILQTQGSQLTKAIAIAAAVGDYFCGPQSGTALLRLRTLAEQLFGIDQKKLTEYLEHCDARIKQAGALLQTNVDSLQSASDLMAQALDQLAQISLRQEQERRQVAALQHETEMEKLVLKSKYEQLQQQALRDGLTNVYNRRFFDEALTNEVRRSARTGDVVSVLFIDADHFKQVNDVYGHKFGDIVLTKIAQVLEESVRERDIVARYGGEEFVILATQTNEAGVGLLAERIRATIASQSIQHSGQRVPVTVSVGAAIGTPNRGDTSLASRLVEAADAAMYESKRRGRNRVTIQSLTSQFDRRLLELAPQFRFSHWLVQHNIIDSALMFDLLQVARAARTHMGEMAVRNGWLKELQLQQILHLQESTGERFGNIAVRLELLTEQQVAFLLGEQVEDFNAIARALTKQGVVEEAESMMLLGCFELEREHAVTEVSSVEPVAAVACG